MSIIAALLLAQASAVPLGSGVKVWDPSMPYPPVVQTMEPSLTGQAFTGPIYQYHCRLFEKTGKQSTLQFKAQGPRGHFGADRKARTTDPKLTVQLDKAGILDGYRFERALKNQFSSPPTFSLRKENNLLKIVMRDVSGDENLPDAKTKQISVMQYLLVDDKLPKNFPNVYDHEYYARWIGFCDETSTPQEPLSDEEVKALVQ